jgi:hypothetical protein
VLVDINCAQFTSCRYVLKLFINRYWCVGMILLLPVAIMMVMVIGGGYSSMTLRPKMSLLKQTVISFVVLSVEH